MWDSSHTYTHHTINQIGTSQSPPLKSLTSSLGPTLCGSVFKSTRGFRVGIDTICNDPRKSASHVCAIPQKDQSLLRLFATVNKAQIYPINTRSGTHHTVNQIGASQSPPLKTLTSSLGPTLWGNVSEPTWGYESALIPSVTTPPILYRYCLLWGLIPLTILFSPKAHSSGGKCLYTLKGGHSLYL